MNRFLSRKFLITLLGMLAIPACKALGHGLDPNACQNIVIVVASYVLGESVVDSVKANALKPTVTSTPKGSDVVVLKSPPLEPDSKP